MNAKPIVSTTSNGISMHATCVAFDAQGVLLTGKSGSGKSALALQLIALGATLVADDRTRLSLDEGQPIAHAPKRLAGTIEARFVGLLRVPYQARVPVCLVVDLESQQSTRLPHNCVSRLLGIEIPLIYKVSQPYFPAAIKLLIQGGRTA